jgi:isocitrate dehydrogenase
MFEAIHGSAPDIAGKNLANPSGLLLAALQMLVHIGQSDVAEKIQNAWLCTIEDGQHTSDIFNESNSLARLGTSQFADAVIARLGKQPQKLKPVHYTGNQGQVIRVSPRIHAPAKKELVGVDIFLHHADRNADALGEALKSIASGHLHLTMITNRGVKVWPNGNPATFCTDHWRCRFKSEDLQPTDFEHVLSLLAQVHQAGFEVIKTEHLYTFDGVAGFTLGQGQ